MTGPVDVGARGFLRIANEADRVTVAAILYKNGYAVAPRRRKKSGSANSYDQILEYEMRAKDLPREEDGTC